MATRAQLDIDIDGDTTIGELGEFKKCIEQASSRFVRVRALRLMHDIEFDDVLVLALTDGKNDASA
jgi:hypothetical protein